MTKLSIIVPVFNVESYLDDCLESLCSQTAQDVEIICVNDGSTDRSGEILARWASHNTEIRIISKTNGGLSSARNIGLANAHGRYVAFVDSDDFVDSEMFEMLLKKAEVTRADIVGCGFKTFPRVGMSHYSFTTGKILSFSELLQSSRRVFSSNDLCFVWRYLFRKQVLDNAKLRFREDVLFAEDGLFVTEAMAASSRFFLIDHPYYHYRKDNPSSLTSLRFGTDRLVALPLIWQAKKEHIQRFRMDDYSPCSDDLAIYTLRSLLFMLLSIRTEEGRIATVSRILSLEMIKDSCQRIGFRNPFNHWKEYLFFLAVKFRFSRLVNRLYYHGDE